MDEQGDQVVMGNKKERIDHILTQDVTNTKDSDKLNSLLYRDKDKEDRENNESKEDSPQNTSMLSFMWGNGKGRKKKTPANKTLRPKNLLKPEEKTIIRKSENAVEISKQGISLKLSESEEGKLKLKISTGKRKDISKKRLAKIAMNAIIKELKKEE